MRHSFISSISLNQALRTILHRQMTHYSVKSTGHNYLIRILPLALVLWPMISAAQTPTDARLARLDTFVNRVLNQWKAPGVAIAVVEKNKVVYAGGFGYRQVEQKLPVDQHTLFAIGSCTKAFTASMLGMLVKEGKVDLDKPVRQYLPELTFEDEYSNAHVNLRDMMCHRTGLPRHDYSWYGSTALRWELLDRIPHLKPSAELREKYQYNNFMFLAQGLVIEKLTGKSWEENLKERLFKPLNMSHSNPSVVEMAQNNNHSKAYNTADFVIKEIPFRNIDAIGPAGSINSCAADMANWLITWIHGGNFMGKEIIPASFVNQAMTAQMVTGGGLPGVENADVHASGYGLAWGTGSYRGHYRVEHGGGIDGFISSTCFFPSDSIGIFVVSNQGAPTSAIRNFIADRMLKLSYRDWSTLQFKDWIKADSLAKLAPDNDSIQQIRDTRPSHSSVAFTGNYYHPGYGTVKIFLENDTLWVDYNEAGKRTKSYLAHYHYNIYTIRSTEEQKRSKDAPKINFQTGNKGEIISLSIRMEPAVDEIVFNRKLEEKTLTKEDLHKYVGEYDLNGATVKVYIRGENVLMVLVPGQPDYELVASSVDKFFIKIALDYKVVFETQGEKVLSLSFVQPNGTFKAMRK